MRSFRHGFTLVEILIVVVILAVLAGVIVPQVSDSTQEATQSTAIFNLNTLRTQIGVYRADHLGAPPTTLVLLKMKTNAQGTTSACDGELAFGPYLQDVPENPLVDATIARVVQAPASSPPTAAVSGAGWLYHAASGGVWLNHPDHLDQ
jgi:general secretion pathway protein G